jgi:hypothetical protein
VVDRPAAAARATSSAFAVATGANASSSTSRDAKASKKAVIWSSEQADNSVKASIAAPTAAATSSCSAAGMCSRSPVSCTTTRRSPSTNAAANAASTDVIRSPPNTIGCPSTRWRRRSTAMPRA